MGQGRVRRETAGAIVRQLLAVLGHARQLVVDVLLDLGKGHLAVAIQVGSTAKTIQEAPREEAVLY